MTGTLQKAKRVRMESQIYCLTHGSVHEATLDPFGEGSHTCFEGMYGERTIAMVWRSVFVGLRKGDYEDEEPM